MRQHDQPLRPSGVVVITVVGIGFLSITIWLWIGMISVCNTAIKMRNAVIVEARILKVDRRTVQKGDGTGQEVTVKYEYHYNKRKFENNTQELSIFGSDLEVARQLDEEFAAGNTVLCFVDPDEPKLSVFSKEFRAGNFILYLLFVSVFSGVSVIFLADFYRRARRALHTDITKMDVKNDRPT